MILVKIEHENLKKNWLKNKNIAHMYYYNVTHTPTPSVSTIKPLPPQTKMFVCPNTTDPYILKTPCI